MDTTKTATLNPAGVAAQLDRVRQLLANPYDEDRPSIEAIAEAVSKLAFLVEEQQKMIDQLYRLLPA